MKKNNFIEAISLIGFVGILLVSSNLAFGQDKQKEELTEKFSKRIESLETLVKEQQKQIESLQNEIDKIKKESPIVTLPSYPNSLKDFSNKLPKGAKPFQFNGKTYYMVPLNILDPNFDKFDKSK